MAANGNIEATITDVRTLPVPATNARALWAVAVSDFVISALAKVTEQGITEGRIEARFEVREASGDKPRRVVITGAVMPHITVSCVVQPSPLKNDQG